MLATLADCGIERIVAGHRTPRCDIGSAKPADGFGIQMNFAGRDEIESLELADRPLRRRIEAADCVERIAEHVEPDGKLEAGWVDIDDAAAYGKFTRLPHSARTVISIGREIFRQRIQIDPVARPQRKRRTPDHLLRWNPLQHCVHRRQQKHRRIRRHGFQRGKPRQRRHTARIYVCIGRNAVVRQTIPGGKNDDLDIRREKSESFGERRHPCIVSRHVQRNDQKGLWQHGIA